MGYIGRIKATDNMKKKIHLPNIGQETIAQTFPLAGTLDEAGNIDHC
jgi:hypothetical protein